MNSKITNFGLLLQSFKIDPVFQQEPARFSLAVRLNSTCIEYIE